MTNKNTAKRLIKVLHIDDEDQLPRDKAYLEAADPDIEVESTSSPEDHLNKIKAGSYDCIVATYKARGIDGIKLARKVKKLTIHPFLLFTSYGTKEVASMAFKAGVDDYVSKGADQAHYEVLARRIRHAVEKHRAEMALNESERKNIALIESLTEGVMILDDERYVTYLNEPLIGLLKIEGREDSPEPFFSIIEREYPPLASLILKSWKGVRTERNDIKLTRQDGKELYLRVSASPRKHENGEHIGTFVTFLDITDLEESRKAIMRSEGEKQAILNAIQDPIRMIDKNLHHLWENNVAKDVLITPREDLRDKPCSEICEKEGNHCNNCIVKQVLDTGNPTDGTMVQRNGQIWNVFSVPILDNSGKPFAAVERLRNITESVVSDIKRSTLHMHALEMMEAKNLNDIIDKTFFALHQVFEYKKTSFYLVQGDAVTAVGSTDPSFQQRSIKESDGAIYRRTIDTGSIQITMSQSKGLRDESSLFQASESGLLLLPVRLSGKIAAILELESDSHSFSGIDEQFLETIAVQIASGLERIQREQSLERVIEEKTAELKEKDRLAAIGETTTMIGHDLRNPLQNIINILYIAEKKIKRVSQEQRSLIIETGIIQDISDIKNRVTYMNKIVSDLQDYARPVIAEKHSTNIVSLVKECLSDVMVPENIVVNVSAEEVDPIVELDPILIKRAFINLITNAVQAMPGGGTLDIRMKDVDGEFAVEFSDTGPGIPAELRDKLFRPLITTKAKGMGMGLPVIKRFIEAHDGSITLTSPPDEGTTFVVKLPRRKKMSATNPSTPDTVSDRMGGAD